MCPEAAASMFTQERRCAHGALWSFGLWPQNTSHQELLMSPLNSMEVVRQLCLVDCGHRFCMQEQRLEM